MQSHPSVSKCPVHVLNALPRCICINEIFPLGFLDRCNEENLRMQAYFFDHFYWRKGTGFLSPVQIKKEKVTTAETRAANLATMQRHLGSVLLNGHVLNS